MGVTDDDVMEGLLIEGLQDWIYLGEVHSSFMPEQPNARPSLHEVQQRTLNMIRELVSEGLFQLGMPSGPKSNPHFESWDLPLEEAMAKIEDAYITHFDDPRNWTNMVWLNLTVKGEKLALERYYADQPDP